jgi:hypothetical protein
MHVFGIKIHAPFSFLVLKYTWFSVLGIKMHEHFTGLGIKIHVDNFVNRIILYIMPIIKV